MMDFNVYLQDAMQSYLDVKDNVRYGQHLMNKLTVLAPDVVIPEHLDPYYDNDKVPNFLNYLWNYWNDQSN